MKNRVRFDVKTQEQADAVLKALVLLGYSSTVAAGVTKYLSAGIPATVVAVNKNDGTPDHVQYSHTVWYDAEDKLEHAINKGLERVGYRGATTAVVLDKSYTAIISPDKTKVTVGCRTFDAAKILELADLIRKSS